MKHCALDNRYPLNTKEQVKTACDYFSHHITKFLPEERVKIASSIKKRAAQLRVKADYDWVHNYSRFMDKQASYSPDFERNIEQRREWLRYHGVEKIAAATNVVTDSKPLLEKIAAHKDSITPQEMAICLGEFDKVAGISQDYDIEINDHIMSVVGSRANPKYDAVKLAHGVTHYDLMNVRCDEEKMEKIASVFNDNVIEAFRENPVDAVIKMRNSEKVVFSDICNS